MAYASPSRTGPGVSCAPLRTSRNWWWWSKVRPRKRARARCSRRSIRYCARIPRSAHIIRRFERILFSAQRGEVKELRARVLEHVDLDAAGQHGAPGLQIGLQPHVACDALAVDLH